MACGVAGSVLLLVIHFRRRTFSVWPVVLMLGMQRFHHMFAFCHLVRRQAFVPCELGCLQELGMLALNVLEHGVDEVCPADVGAMGRVIWKGMYRLLQLRCRTG